MAVDPPRKPDPDYIRIFAQKLQGVPAWKELAQAANQILVDEVDNRRRKLEKIRDSVKYRRNDVLVNVDYEPEADKPMVDEITGIPFVPPNSDPIRFRTGKVVNVIKNLSYYYQKDTTDYLDLRVSYDGRDYRWLKPFQSPQERDILLKNAYRLGFNFFNTKLSDEDLQRLTEFIQMYWNEAGADDNFMKFIGFVKNTRFDLVALWTEGPAEPVPGVLPYTVLTFTQLPITGSVQVSINGAVIDPAYYKVEKQTLTFLQSQTSPVTVSYSVAGPSGPTTVQEVLTTTLDSTNFQYPYLEPFSDGMSSVKDGGQNWITSHVQIEYDLAQFNKFYIVNLDDLEQLFYYFAPIILVLERIVGTLEVVTPVYGINAVSLTSFNYDFLEPATHFITEILCLGTAGVVSYNYAVLNTGYEGCLGLDGPVNLQQTCFDFLPYLLAGRIL